MNKVLEKTIIFQHSRVENIKKNLEMNGKVVPAPCQKIQDLQNCECCTFTTLLL